MNQSFNRSGFGDGCFQLSKKGYASLEITMRASARQTLFVSNFNKAEIWGFRRAALQRAFNLYAIDCVKRRPRSGLNSFNQWRAAPLRATRLIQLKKICDKYDIDLLFEPLSYNNGWLSGMIDSDGSIYLNLQSDQLFISIGAHGWRPLKAARRFPASGLRDATNNRYAPLPRKRPKGRHKAAQLCVRW
jgi:hypothetical protein